MRYPWLVLGLTIAAPATAGPFDGTWKADLGSAQVNARPKVRSISNGVYRCTSCVPPYSIPADGRSHAVPVDENGDHELVRVVDSRTVRVQDMKGKRTVATYTFVALPDGRTVRVTSKEVGANGKVVTSEALQRRIASGPKGSHPISGSWQDAKIERADDAGLTISIHEAKGVLHVTLGTGQSYDAPIGGPSVAVKGDLAGTMASVRRTSPNTLVETDTVKGKVVSVNTMTLVAPRTMKIVSEDKQHGGVGRFVAHKS